MVVGVGSGEGDGAAVGADMPDGPVSCAGFDASGDYVATPDWVAARGESRGG